MGNPPTSAQITAILRERGLYTSDCEEDDAGDLALHRCPHMSFDKTGAEHHQTMVLRRGKQQRSLRRQTSVQEMKSFMKRLWRSRSVFAMGHAGHGGAHGNGGQKGRSFAAAS